MSSPYFPWQPIYNAVIHYDLSSPESVSPSQPPSCIDRLVPPSLPSLHLTPSSWAELPICPTQPDQLTEFVDGILVNKSMEHVDHTRVPTYWDNISHTPSWTSPFSSSPPCKSIAGTSLQKRILKKKMNRRPDFAGKLQNAPSSPCSVTSTEFRQYYSFKFAKVMMFTLEFRPDFVVEFTSLGTRFTDIIVKWVEYSLIKIKMYIIVDTENDSPDG